MANSFSSRFKQFTQRLRETTQIPLFTEQQSSESQSLARELSEAGDCVIQLSQVVMEIEILNQLHTRLVYEREALQQEKADLETRVFELQQERNELEPQVMYLREQFNQATLQLEQTQNRERNLSDRERQLTEIVAQLERRRAVLNQTIENLTGQEADFIVRMKELSTSVTENEKKAKQYIDVVNHYKAYLEELKAQVEEQKALLQSMGVKPKEQSLPDHPEPAKPAANPPQSNGYSSSAPSDSPSDLFWDEVPEVPGQPATPPSPTESDQLWGNPWG
jgi:chromosome segregation ATPase